MFSFFHYYGERISVLIASSIFVAYFLFVIYELSHERRRSLIPICFNLSKRILCEIVSNALARSKFIPRAAFSFSIILVTVDFSLRKPNCWGMRSR